MTTGDGGPAARAGADPGSVAEALDVESELARLLPPELQPLFGRAFIRSHRLYGEFVYRLVLGIGRDLGLDRALGEPLTTGEVAATASLDPAQSAVPLDWILRLLASRGVLETVAGGTLRRYRSREPWPMLDPAPVRQQQDEHDRTWEPAYALAETVARDYPAFLRGQVTGEDVLFAPRRLRLWVDYFANDNGLYAVNNRVGAVAAATWVPPGEPLTIVELGGGLGSGAVALIERLVAAGRVSEIAEYRFTEFVSAFLRRGEQVLRARFPELPAVRTGPLDMNRSFAEQGVRAGTAGVVYAVNTLHVARDLGFTLGEIRRALRPGGYLVASECMRAIVPTYADFVFALADTFRSPLLHPVYRPAGGFLAPAEWRAALDAAGFGEIRFLPDIERVRERVPDFLVAAIGGRRLA